MKRPTQQDVAELAGVSRAAVSYVINGRDEGPILISEETRQKILAAAHQLGYEPNAAAVSLRSQMSHTIGLLIPDMFNPHYWQITRGVEGALHEQGYDLLLMSTSLNPEREHTALRSLLRRRVDGLILVLTFVDREKQEIQTIIHRKSPVVLLGAESTELDTVIPNDEQGTLEMLRHLAAQGHRRIALLYGVAHRHGRAAPGNLPAVYAPEFWTGQRLGRGLRADHGRRLPGRPAPAGFPPAPNRPGGDQ